MAKKDEMTSYVFLWEGPDGERKWEAVNEKQVNGFLAKLLEEHGVHPATIMVAYAPILFHWVWKKYHKISDVSFHRINEEIYGTEPAEISKHKPVNVPVERKPPEIKYGWLAPDGRFFKCDYGAHSHLAGKIVGDIQYIPNPERHLEDLGWAKVLSGGNSGSRYAVGMGIEKRLTDAQLKTLQRMGLDQAFGVSYLL